jgi:type I restriction enzyme S subunit
MAVEEAGAVTIEALLESGAIVGHKDGNHGSQYPRVEEFGPVGVPFLTAKSLSDGKIDIAGAPRLAEDRADALRFGFVQPGDVLLSHNATVGRVAVVPEFAGRMLIGTSLTYFRVDPEKISPRYLAAYFGGKAFQDELAAVMSHSTRNQVPITAQRRLRVVLPSLPVQRGIAHILGTLDDKIELNRRMNETLEATARAIFKSWFVDFDPVRAKAEGRDTGLPPHIADLFPDAFEDSELGEIPKGWAVRSLDEIADFLNGLAMQKYPPTTANQLPVIKIAQLRAGDANGADLASADIDPAYIIEDGDILFSWSGSLECVLWSGGKGALNQHLFKVTPSRYPRWLCYLGIQQHLDEFRHIAAGKATTMGHIQRQHLSDAKLPIPPADLLKTMGTFVEPAIESTWRRMVQSRTLMSLRDTLLPKLISGELRLEGAERLIGGTDA